MRWLIVALLVAVGCDQKPKTPHADAASEEAPRELTAQDRATRFQAELGVVTAIDTAAMEALRKVEKLGSEQSMSAPQDVRREDTTKFTVFFGANNHGERNDCGCKKNPLGGLGRRHTLLAALTDEGFDLWKDAGGPAVGPVFHVDAGDLFFKANSIDRMQPAGQKQAKYDAESVALAMATSDIDAIGVGEHDLVFGAEYLRGITSKPGLKLLSANVRDERGELVFDPSVVLERDGVKIGVVAVTNAKSRFEDYYKKRGLTVDDPFEAAKRAIGELPPTQAVVLLSNIGLVDTQALVEKLVDSGTSLQLAVSSGTNRMTKEPEFAAGIPVLEPLSRGKYVGRADFWLNGTQTAFRNSSLATPSSLRDYRRAVRSYWSTRKQVLREKLKIAELEMSLETIEKNEQPDAGKVTAELAKRRKESIDAQTKRMGIYNSRLEGTSESLLRSLKTTRPPEAPTTGDDWVVGSVVPVKIEIVPEKKTRKVIDRREKKRPDNSNSPRMKLAH